MRQPGIEPGSTAWKAAMLTTIPLTLDNKIIKKSLIHTYLIYCKLCCISLQIFEKPFSFIFHSHYMEHYAQQRHCSVCTLLFCLVFTCQSIIIIKLHIPPGTKCEILFDLFFCYAQQLFKLFKYLVVFTKWEVQEAESRYPLLTNKHQMYF